MKDQLEMFIDRYGIEHALSLLVEICNDKADHIETNWQDKQLAKRWEATAKRIQAVSESKTIQAVNA